MEASEFLKGRTRETKIRRDARGRWFNAQDPIDHPKLVKSFDGWIDRAKDGRFCLSNDINWAYIQLEGPPYIVRDVEISPDQVVLQLSGDRREVLELDTLHQDNDGGLWCVVREGRCPARFDNHASAKLGELMGEDQSGVFIKLGAKRVHPRTVDEPLALGA